MKNYNVKTISRAAMPRSKRLRDSGAQTSSGGFINAGGEIPTQPTPTGDGHTHSNKSDLDAISIDDEGYLFLRRKPEGESESEIRKVKSGQSDETVSTEFTHGPLGSGHRVYTDPETGESFAEVDHLEVRKTMTVYELIIQQLRHQGGIVFFTAAGIECTSVEETDDGYICFFDTKDGAVYNEFVVGDQARCQHFSSETLTAKYYWRLVTEVGEDYIVLSKTDCDTGSGVPDEGDVIVQCGHRTDVTRQSAKITRTVGQDAPRDEYYAGISGYNLTSKLITVVGVKDGEVGIYTTQGEFKGKITALQGKIAGFKLEGDSLTTADPDNGDKVTLTPKFLVFQRMLDSVLKSYLAMGQAAFAELGYPLLMNGILKATGQVNGMGISMSVEGASQKNYAFYAAKGDFARRDATTGKDEFAVTCESVKRIEFVQGEYPEEQRDDTVYVKI